MMYRNAFSTCVILKNYPKTWRTQTGFETRKDGSYLPSLRTKIDSQLDNVPNKCSHFCIMPAEESFGFTKDTEALSRRNSFTETLAACCPNSLNCGFLQKRSSTGQWNKRWVVIHGHYLSCMPVVV